MEREAGTAEWLHGSCQEVLQACVHSGDLHGALSIMEKLRAQGLALDSSSLSAFFEVSKDEAGADSFPPYLRLLRKQRGSPLHGLQNGPPFHLLKGAAEGLAAIGKAERAACREGAWAGVPQEVLGSVLERADMRAAVAASGVCRDWRVALGQGVLELSFSWCGVGVSPLLTSVIRHFKSLQVLCLRRCPSLTDEAVEAAAVSCHSLRALDLSTALQLSDGAMEALARGCPALEGLDLSGCLGIGERGLQAVAAACSSLRWLNLCGCERAATDWALQVLARNCSSLKSLNLGWCERVSDDGIVALAQGCQSLEIIDLCGCLLITDRSVMALADHCPNLEVFGLHCCRLITDRSMRALVGGRARFLASNRLRISGTRGTFGTGTEGGSVAENRENLSGRSRHSGALSSSGESYFTLAMLNRPHAPRAAGLVSLNLSGCILLHAAAVQAVCDTFPDLHTCSERNSLNISGCLALTTVRCRCIREDRNPQVPLAGSQQVITPRNRPL